MQPQGMLDKILYVVSCSRTSTPFLEHTEMIGKQQSTLSAGSLALITNAGSCLPTELRAERSLATASYENIKA